jgi:hypothetical protein
MISWSRSEISSEITTQVIRLQALKGLTRMVVSSRITFALEVLCLRHHRVSLIPRAFLVRQLRALWVCAKAHIGAVHFLFGVNLIVQIINEH